MEQKNRKMNNSAVDDDYPGISYGPATKKLLEKTMKYFEKKAGSGNKSERKLQKMQQEDLLPDFGREMEDILREQKGYRDTSKHLESRKKHNGKFTIKLDVKEHEQSQTMDKSYHITDEEDEHIVEADYVKQEHSSYEDVSNHLENEIRSGCEEHIVELESIEQKQMSYENKSAFMTTNEEKVLEGEYCTELDGVGQEQIKYKDMSEN